MLPAASNMVHSNDHLTLLISMNSKPRLSCLVGKQTIHHLEPILSLKGSSIRLYFCGSITQRTRFGCNKQEIGMFFGCPVSEIQPIATGALFFLLKGMHVPWSCWKRLAPPQRWLITALFGHSRNGLKPDLSILVSLLTLGRPLV